MNFLRLRFAKYNGTVPHRNAATQSICNMEDTNNAKVGGMLIHGNTPLFTTGFEPFHQSHE